jgi:7-keto-8-aminopelargonate synthetase-like enzyme
MASLSKAIPSNGGFLAGTHDLMTYLQHGAGTFMFSAALAPPSTAAALAAFQILRREQGARQVRLRRNAEELRDGLRSLGYETGNSESPIIPVLTGEVENSFRLARALYSRGILVSAVIPPAVKAGQCRLRLCATAAHTRDDIDEALQAFGDLADGFAGAPGPARERG